MARESWKPGETTRVDHRERRQPVPSDVKQVVEIAPKSGGRVKLKAGERLRIVDVAGQQVADLFAVATDDFDKWLSTSTPRELPHRSFPVRVDPARGS